jgi:phospholipid/cholesterol/gamma-HCH transport system permease protein
VTASLTTHDSSPAQTDVLISGALDLEGAKLIWQPLLEAAASATGNLTIDLAGISICDGTGLGLLAQAERVARKAGAVVEWRGAPAGLAELLRMARIEPSRIDHPGPETGIIRRIGAATAHILSDLRSLIDFVGGLTVAIPSAIAGMRSSRLLEILRNCARVGADAVPVVGFLGLLIGFILSVQATNALQRVGTTSLVPMVIGFATFREFAALIAAIILAGRSGSAFAAEIGTMKITEELDAYRTLALDPMIVLVVPRVIASVVVTPLLTIFSIVLAVLGGWIPLVSLGYSLPTYVRSVFETVVPADLVQALVKSVVFGLLVAMLGCFHGLQTRSGADAVGASTTRAVVWAIVAVLIADSVLSSIFYTLGY